MLLPLIFHRGNERSNKILGIVVTPSLVLIDRVSRITRSSVISGKSNELYREKGKRLFSVSNKNIFLMEKVASKLIDKLDKE